MICIEVCILSTASEYIIIKYFEVNIRGVSNMDNQIILRSEQCG